MSGETTPGNGWQSRYTPSPSEIAAACAMIQTEWNEREERSRRVHHSPDVMPREVRIHAAG